MISIRFKTRTDRLSSQGYPVILYVNIHNKRYNFYTDIYISKPEYLQDNKLSRKEPLYQEKNKRITEILSKVSILLLENKENIKDEIAAILKNRPSPSSSKPFTQLMDEFIKTKSSKGAIDITVGLSRR